MIEHRLKIDLNCGVGESVELVSDQAVPVVLTPVAEITL